jgi:NAD(P)-dependent dehydrogenase (short-subunit alcohol dehydrogenase family)
MIRTNDLGQSFRASRGNSDSAVVRLIASSFDGLSAKYLGAGKDGLFTGPDEVADLVVMLARDRCANMMGVGVTIDGGMVPTL